MWYTPIVLHHTAPHCNSLQLTATHCNTQKLLNWRRMWRMPIVLQHTAALYSILQLAATHCETHEIFWIGDRLCTCHLCFSSLQHAATRCIHCNSLQLTATHCNTQEILNRRQMWYTPMALGLLELNHPVRRCAIDIIECKWFERMIHLTIAANCVQMAIDDPRDTGVYMVM